MVRAMLLSRRIMRGFLKASPLDVQEQHERRECLGLFGHVLRLHPRISSLDITCFFQNSYTLVIDSDGGL
jgi:hypothetical protein